VAKKLAWLNAKRGLLLVAALVAAAVEARMGGHFGGFGFFDGH